MSGIAAVLTSFVLIGVSLAQPAQNAGPAASNRVKPRVVVTTDPELDDSNSLVRFLLYSTDVRVEGLVYASSQFHWKGDGKGTKWSVPGREYTRFGLNLCPCTSWRWAPGERFIDDAVEAYEKVRSPGRMTPVRCGCASTRKMPARRPGFTTPRMQPCPNLARSLKTRPFRPMPSRSEEHRVGQA